MNTAYNVRVQYAAWVAACTMGAVVVLAALDLATEVRYRSEEAQLRAEVLSRGMAGALVPALATNDLHAVTTIVADIVGDQGVLDVQVMDPAGKVLVQPWETKETAHLVVATSPINSRGRQLGSVTVGVSTAPLSRRLLQIVLLDLGVGLLVVVGAVAGAAIFASRPVRDALQQLYDHVRLAADGKASSEPIDSELAEVNEISTLLASVLRRVQEGQGKLVRARQELKSAQKEMDEYTYVISHDLKEPLRGIEAFSKFLVEDYREQLDENGRHHIDVIRNSALRMQRLINDLLKFSRLGQQKNPLVPVGLNTMLMHVRVNLQYAIDAKKVDLRVDKLPTVMCDATAMTEVFHNLISNAIKYNDKPHPVVEVGCREVTNPETGRGEFEFHVRDNGPGIKPEYHEKIFQLFQRLHRDDEGTGIGLTIVKRVMEWHGGRVWVESAEGQGTTFHFTVPMERAPEDATRTQVPESENQFAATI